MEKVVQDFASGKVVVPPEGRLDGNLAYDGDNQLAA